MRWTFEDETTSATWTFVRNPFEMQSPVTPRRTEVLPRGLAQRYGDQPFPWQFRGRVRTQAEYDTLAAWALCPHVVRITDHLGRIHRVIPQHFDPEPRRSRRGMDWRFDYTFKALYLGRGE